VPADGRKVLREIDRPAESVIARPDFKIGGDPDKQAPGCVPGLSGSQIYVACVQGGGNQQPQQGVSEVWRGGQQTRIGWATDIACNVRTVARLIRRASLTDRVMATIWPHFRRGLDLMPGRLA
jgi:hypothetical protein